MCDEFQYFERKNFVFNLFISGINNFDTKLFINLFFRNDFVTEKREI